MAPLLVSALNRQPLTGPAPVWLMRQAGRYLPEYRQVRAQFPDFIAFCLNPDAATEVTLQPITRFDLDAAIIFADILTIPHALGHTVTFAPDHGPQVQKLLNPGQIAEMNSRLPELAGNLANVGKTISQTRAALPGQKAVIGFSGAPFTLASYLLDDKPSKGVPVTIGWLSEQPQAWNQLMDLMVNAITAYLRMQADAGADALQIFDSWAGACPAEYWQQAVHGPLERIVTNLKHSHPQLPVILFPRGASQSQLQAMATAIPAALSLGNEVDMAWAGQTLQPHTAIQGNLDPLLFTEENPTNLLEAIRNIQTAAALKPGFVWNLGHGLTPQTRIESVQACINAIRS